MHRVGSRPRRRARAMLALTALAILALAPSALAQYTYDVNQYHSYTSRSTWWPHATTTNNTASTVSWRVSYSVRRCQEWSGAVRLIKQASGSYGTSSCSTTSHTGRTSVAPYTSAALLARDVMDLNYFEVRKFSTSTGRLVEQGYATQRDSYTQFTFSAHF